MTRKERYYLAASYSRRLEMQAAAATIRAAGAFVTSTWHDGHHERRGSSDFDQDPSEMALWAKEDVYDLERANVLLSFTEPEQSHRRKRGGRHVEFGMALA